jgi:DNA ligase-1
MKRFAELYAALDDARGTLAKRAALEAYFRAAPPGDAAWALHFLLGRRGRRAVQTGRLRAWAADLAGLPQWLVEECHDAVGDLAEAIALVIPDDASGRPDTGPGHPDRSLTEVATDHVLRLADVEDAERERVVKETLSGTNALERLVYVKLITGAFRVGASQGIVARALADVAGVDAATMAHRLAGRWDPDADAFARLMGKGEGELDPLRPYPFFLAHPVPVDPTELGEARAFQAEWKWDGIRAQAVRRAGEALLWSRGEELVDRGFPEIIDALQTLPDGTVLDGELLAWREDRPLGFQALQRRIARKAVSPKLRAEVPVRFLAYDLLEAAGEDLRGTPLEERRRLLGALLDSAHIDRERIGLSPLVSGNTWQELAARRDGARELGVEGLMLKRRGSVYSAGRPRGDWWKWKVDPYSIDAVLVYAQRGHGRRAALYTDYTLAVWDEGALVPVAKAYSGLDDAEIRRVDNFVRRHIRERFGPVRVVEPRLVFEVAFEGLQRSSRHKAGLALRFPRIARWREDKNPEEADTLDTLRELLRAAPAREEDP